MFVLQLGDSFCHLGHFLDAILSLLSATGRRAGSHGSRRIRITCDWCLVVRHCSCCWRCTLIVPATAGPRLGRITLWRLLSVTVSVGVRSCRTCRRSTVRRTSISAAASGSVSRRTVSAVIRILNNLFTFDHLQSVLHLATVQNQIGTLPRTYHVVNADDVLLVGVLRVANDSGAGLYPNVAAVLVHHAPVVG